MKKEMLPLTGKWYKGNLHCHTTNSDGSLTPGQVVDLYGKHGYSFLCLSEHDVYTDLRTELNKENFILLPGVEASAWLLRVGGINEAYKLTQKKRTFPELVDYLCHAKAGLIKTHHIHGILGTDAMQKAAGDKLIQPGEQLIPHIYLDSWNGLHTAQKLSDTLRSRGLFTTYNHPVWSRVDVEELTDLQSFWALEVYNYGTQIECGEGKGEVFWDAMLRKGIHIHSFASDDNHNHSHLFDSLGGWVCVRAEELTHETIVRHLLAGEYYSSTGPQVYQWGIDEDTVSIQCSDVTRIHFITGGGVGASKTVLRNAGSLTGAFHCLRGDETYVRIECEDEVGRIAWTNVLWL